MRPHRPTRPRDGDVEFGKRHESGSAVSCWPVVMGNGLRGKALAVTVADDAVVRWLAGLQDHGLLPVLRGVAVIGSWTTIGVLEGVLILALAVLRRWRHLLVFVVAYNVAGVLV